MPPRSPTVKPHCRARSSRGRMPAETMIMSTSSESPSVNSIRSTRPLPWTSLVPYRDARARPSLRFASPASANRRRRSAGASSAGANSTTCVSSPSSWAAFAASSPSSPPPITAQRLRLFRIVDDPLQIFDRAIDEHAALVDARHRRHERKRTCGQHDFVVGDLDPFVGTDDPALCDRSRLPDRRDATRRRAPGTTPSAPASVFRHRDGRRTSSGRRGRTPPAALRRT